MAESARFAEPKYCPTMIRIFKRKLTAESGPSPRDFSGHYFSKAPKTFSVALSHLRCEFRDARSAVVSFARTRSIRAESRFNRVVLERE